MCRHVHQRHRGCEAATSAAMWCGCSPRACRPGDAVPGRDPAFPGGENDSPTPAGAFRQQRPDNGATGMNVRVIYRRDRYLRGGDHIPFLERGYPAARFTEPNENFAHQHQDVRVVDGSSSATCAVLRLRVHRGRREGESRDALVVATHPGRPRSAGRGPARSRTRPSWSGAWHRAGPPATRWCGARRPRRIGRSRSGSAASHRHSTSRRTTCSSACARWTRPVIEAR